MIERNSTQWAAQFFAAGELIKRGYIIGFTFGNTRSADILVASPNNNNFRVDVKGHIKSNSWDVRYKEPEEDLYYILVDVFEDPPKYYIFPSVPLMAEVWRLYNRAMKRRREKHRKGEPSRPYGVYQSFARQNEGQWDLLPP